MDEITNLSTKDEPWCSSCCKYTDYKRKWSTVPRANLDGGTYSDISEIPHCVDCGRSMLYLTNCRILVYGVRILCFIQAALLSVLCFYFYEATLYSLFTWILGVTIILIISQAPVASRKALTTHKFYLQRKKILDGRS